MKILILIAIAFLSVLEPARAELSIFSIGYDLDKPTLADSGKLERNGISGMYGAIHYPLQLPRPLPSARFLWLGASYSYYSGQLATENFDLRMHNFQLTSSLYTDLLDQLLFLNQLVIFTGVGVGATRAEAAGDIGISGAYVSAKQWLFSGKATFGIAGALVGRLGPKIQLTYRFPNAHEIGDIDVDFNKFAVQVGIAYIPDEDDFLLNW